MVGGGLKRRGRLTRASQENFNACGSGRPYSCALISADCGCICGCIAVTYMPTAAFRGECDKTICHSCTTSRRCLASGFVS